MQHQSEGTRLPEQLFNGGANDTASNVSRGLESVGVPQDISDSIGRGYVAIFVAVAIFLYFVYNRWIGSKTHPPKKKKKKKR
jgi:hypothetical protein